MAHAIPVPAGFGDDTKKWYRAEPGAAFRIMQCAPGIEEQVHSAVRQTVGEPELFGRELFGECDEAPLNRVYCQTLTPGYVKVIAVPNMAYFDGETEIAESFAEQIIAKIFQVCW